MQRYDLYRNQALKQLVHTKAYQQEEQEAKAAQREPVVEETAQNKAEGVSEQAHAAASNNYNPATRQGRQQSNAFVPGGSSIADFAMFGKKDKITRSKYSVSSESSIDLFPLTA